ncbi:alpha/beta-hydrolase [Meredithblackwellia eburnea MCA 4105]
MAAKDESKSPQVVIQNDMGWGPKSQLSELLTIKEEGFYSRSFLNHAKHSTPLALLRFTIHGVLNFLSTLFLSPATLLFDPLSSFASCIIYPVIFLGLIIVCTVLWLGSILGGSSIVRLISKIWFNNYNAPNLDPTIFKEESNHVIAAALPVLEGGATTVPAVIPSSHKQGCPPSATTRFFSLPLARTLLLFSAIVYERDDSLVYKAGDVGSKDPALAEQYLKDSEKRIRKKADFWKLNYEGISSLSTPSGPFASIFYPREAVSSDQGNLSFRPWIALIFKGTSADNFAEILVDANISRTPAGAFFGAGTAHEGFYSGLFPENTGGADAYSTIRAHLKHTASELRRKSTNPITGQSPKVPLWVSGHSLGSALAGLIFARFLESPEDLGDDIELRDCYLFGTPRLGDGNFCSAFEKNLVTPVDRPNILWRVVNNLDIVTMVPPGLADHDSQRANLGLSVLNYGHIGTQVKLAPYMKPFYSINNGYFRNTTNSLVQDALNEPPAGQFLSTRLTSLNRAGWNPFRILLCVILPSPMLDHFPASYYHRLSQIDVKSQTSPTLLQHEALLSLGKREFDEVAEKAKEALRGSRNAIGEALQAVGRKR